MKRFVLVLGVLTGCNGILGLQDGWHLASLDAADPVDGALVPIDGHSPSIDAGRAETPDARRSVDAREAEIDAPIVDIDARQEEIDAHAVEIDAHPKEIDARAGIPDAAEPDAMPPPITNDQAANLVLGQSTYTTSTMNLGGESASSLSWPVSVAVDSNGLWVLDDFNVRVLEWSPFPTTNDQAADELVGEASYTATAAIDDQSQFGGIGAVFSSGKHLFVADSGDNRVLIWQPLPTTVGPKSWLVLGQSSFMTETAAKTAGGLDGPAAVWSDDTHIIVADTKNNRVVIWNSFPTTSGANANVVLGWNSFGLGDGDTVASPPTSSSLNYPQGVFYDGKHLWVADTRNCRVLGWNGIPTTSGAAADVVIGQSTFADDTCTTSATNLDQPIGIWVQGDTLFVADSLNYRVVAYTPVPTKSGVAASAVLGQVNLTHRTDGASATLFNFPAGVAATATELYVADQHNSRILGFALK